MKILMLTDSLIEGGAETHIVTLSVALVKRGHDVTVASSGGAYVDTLMEEGVRHVNINFTSRSLIAILSSEREIEAISEGVDIVHAHTRYTAAIAGPVCKRLKIPLVTTAHWVFELSQPKKMLTRWGDSTLAVSEDIKKYLIENYSLSEDRITITVNGIDTEKFSPPKASEKKDFFEMIHVSRIDRGRAECAFKLTEAAQELAKLLPNGHITIVGSGNMFEELCLKVLDVNRKIGREYVTLVGARTDVAPRLKEAELFIGVSRAALEAMACERPVILCGDEGYGGILYPRKVGNAAESNFCCRGDGDASTQKLVRDILHLANMSEGERKMLGSSLRRIILDGYSEEKMVNDALGVYASLTAKQPKKKLLLCGYIGAGNAGDEIMLAALLRKLRASGSLSVCSVSACEKDTSRLHCVETVGKKNIMSIVSKIRECDVFILGGGNLLQNKTSSRSLFYYAMLFKMAKRRGCKTYLCSAGIGELSGEWAEDVAQEILRGCDGAYMRTHKDAERARELAGAAAIIYRYPDISLSVCKPIYEKDGTFAVSITDSAEEFGLARDEYTSKLARILNAVSKEVGLRAKIIVMHGVEDLEISCEVSAKVAGATLVRDATPIGIVNEISRSNLSISQRLHHAYISLGCEVPTAHFDMDVKSRDMAHDVKQNDGFFRLLPRDLYGKDLIGTITALARYDGDELSKYADNARRMSECGVDKLCESIIREASESRKA